MDLIKCKSFYKNKRHHTEWKKTFANDMTNKGLIFKIYKQFIQPNMKTNHLIYKWAKGLNRHLPQRHTEYQQVF